MEISAEATKKRDSLVVLVGTVGSIVLLDRGIRFTLHTGHGHLSITAQPGVGYGWLHPAAEVCVIGWVRSYYYQPRRVNRVVIEATRLLPTVSSKQASLSRIEQLALLYRLVYEILDPAVEPPNADSPGEAI